jgi:hypothetical protein
MGKRRQRWSVFLKLRHIEQEDCEAILEVASDWWGSNYSSDMFSKWFIDHFRETCLLAEKREDDWIYYGISITNQTR